MNRRPLPNDEIFTPDAGGLARARVIASVPYRDEPDEPEIWTVMVLLPTSPYFQVGHVTIPDADACPAPWRLDAHEEPVFNINEAIAQYRDWGGDY